MKCMKEVKKVDSVKRAGSKRSMGTRKRLREARGSFFKKCKSEKGSGREEGNRREQD